MYIAANETWNDITKTDDSSGQETTLSKEGYQWFVTQDENEVHRLGQLQAPSTNTTVSSWDPRPLDTLNNTAGYEWQCRAFDGLDYSDWSGWREVYSMNFTNSNCSVNTALNITYLDEDTLLNMNGTIKPLTFTFNSADNYYYTNQENTELPSQTYCLNGPTYLDNTSLSLTPTGTIKYDATGYPLRTHFFSSALTGNNVTNLALYLLSSDDGIYSSIQVQNTASVSIPGALIVVERQFTGVWVEIGRGNTDDAGMVTFWVNPNYEHRYTISADTYETKVVTITPTQETYTVQLVSTGQDVLEYESGQTTIQYNLFPALGPITTTGTFNFGYDISSDQANLRGCRVYLNYKNGTNIGNETGCDTASTYAGDTISVSYNLQAGDRLKAVLELRIASTCSTEDNICAGGPRDGQTCGTDTDCEIWGVMDADAWWDQYNVTTDTGAGLRGVFTNLKGWNAWSSNDIEAEYSRTMAVFLALFILLGVFTSMTRWDSQWPGATLIAVWGIIMFLSMTGWFTYNITSSSFMNKYTVAVTVTAMFIGWGLNTWGRNG
tara:strand:- start:1632 stop:3281 length:1650 start_codon:yes stop_codon:yes gene_type:complete